MDRVVTVARRKGDAGKADLLFSRLVRSRGACERCGQPATDTAHIVRRRYSATRCDERNAWALCRPCHRLTEEFPDEFMHLVDCTIGRGLYEELRRIAEAGLATSSRLFWRGEVERLTARCVELGIDTRWKAAS
jgi:hypothetical protein